MSQLGRSKTGRNDPCPCGSGRKFKRCHAIIKHPPITGSTSVGGLTETVSARPRRYLSAPECRSIAKSLRGALETYAITPSPGSDIAKWLVELEWLARMIVVHTGVHVPTAEKARYDRAFAMVDQASRIASALDALRGVDGVELRARWLKERFDRLETSRAKAQDFLWELEVAGRLARGGLFPAFQEPDITVRACGETVKLPCKRPRSLARIRDALRRASDQVDAHGGGPALTIVGVEAIVQPARNEDVPRHAFTAPNAFATREDFHAATRTITRDLRLQTTHDVEGHLRHEGIVGVIMAGIVAGTVAEAPPGYVGCWVTMGGARGDPTSAAIFKAVGNALLLGGPA